MKQFLFSFISFSLLTACNNSSPGTETSAPSKDSTSSASISYPYTASYSSQFEIGEPSNAKLVLDLWKDWENNTLDEHSNLFADTVTFFFHDGSVLKTSRDSLIAIGKKERAKYSSVKDDVQAWIPANSKDKNEKWVLVWGHNISTKEGKTDSLDLQETWLIKDGKASVIYQYARKFGPQK